MKRHIFRRGRAPARPANGANGANGTNGANGANGAMARRDAQGCVPYIKQPHLKQIGVVDHCVGDIVCAVSQPLQNAHWVVAVQAVDASQRCTAQKRVEH